MKNLRYLLVLLVFVSCKKEEQIKETKLQGGVFGTMYHITYLDDVNYQESIDSLFQLVNKSLSTYMPTSDISKINQGDSTIVVDAMFEEVFQKSKRIFKETNGYFDPTVCELVNAWGFGYKKEKKDLDSLQVKELMKLVGFNKIELKDKKVVKQFSEMCLDFNSIAKGYGSDVVGRFLESKNVSNYLVEIGGEIRARGKNKRNKFWTVAIDDPNTDGTRSVSRYVELDNQSMAGSGNYRKFRMTKDGRKVVHTISPKTGFATESNLLSATVYGKVDCADVDAYATSFMAMGLEKSKAFLEKHPEIKAVLLYANDKGEIEEFKN
ncbi:FAD:protein FMN transferase [uncultured Tenacibaculum sp.]|uniref:FAD:protein FMN transferase n=1 Tax=uncultured Tenacibaculum sp. TaxID=174713 RepID=UPI0026313868|nr:FAD:protein FMN transferase [uncultured Tenacibaculum sp.]